MGEDRRRAVLHGDSGHDLAVEGRLQAGGEADEFAAILGTAGGDGIVLAEQPDEGCHAVAAAGLVGQLLAELGRHARAFE